MATAARPLTTAELAARLDCELEGSGDFLVTGVAALADAGSGDLSFARSQAYADALGSSAAGAVILPPDLDAGTRPALRSADPALHFARAVEILVTPERPSPGVHPSASVDATASVDASAAVGSGVCIGAGASVGAGSVLHARSVIYAGVVVGRDCEVHAGVVLREGTRVGDRVRLQPGVVIGGDGFGFLPSDEGVQRVPQLGGVVIEDDVEIGAGTTVDRGTLADTRIRRGAKIDNLVMIAHNCDIGEDAIVVAQSGLAGSTRVGDRAILMARVGSAGHLKIGDGAFVGARSGLHRDVPAGARVYGSPASEERAWHREVAALHQLPRALRRLRKLEGQVGESDSDDDA